MVVCGDFISFLTNIANKIKQKHLEPKEYPAGTGMVLAASLLD